TASASSTEPTRATTGTGTDAATDPTSRGGRDTSTRLAPWATTEMAVAAASASRPKRGSGTMPATSGRVDRSTTRSPTGNDSSTQGTGGTGDVTTAEDRWPAPPGDPCATALRSWRPVGAAWRNGRQFDLEALGRGARHREPQPAD